MQESPSNKYLQNLEDAIAEDSYALIKIFEPTIKVMKELEKAPISGEAKYIAGKRMKKFVQDVYAAIPNQYKLAVQELVQEALFPEVKAEMDARVEELKQAAVSGVMADLQPANTVKAI